MAGIHIAGRDKESVDNVLLHLEYCVQHGTCLLDLITYPCCLARTQISLIISWFLNIPNRGGLEEFKCTEISQMTNFAVRTVFGWHRCALPQTLKDTTDQHILLLSEGFDVFSYWIHSAGPGQAWISRKAMSSFPRPYHAVIQCDATQWRGCAPVNADRGQLSSEIGT